MTLSPRVAAELLVILTAAASANAAAVRILEHGCATCSHLEQAHALDGKGRRRACSTSTGPTAMPCPCTVFAPILEADT